MAKVDTVTHNVKMSKEAKRPKWQKMTNSAKMAKIPELDKMAKNA